MMEIISTELFSQDLFVDAIYGGSRKGNYSDNPLPALLGVDNGAGFRCLGSPRTEVDSLKLLVLQTDFSNLDWPDELDIENGLFTYYGDKRAPGDLHDTKRDGNKILRSIFEYCHGKPSPTTAFPPILLFRKRGTYRDTRFLGLAVPGAKGMSSDEDLTAIWRTSAEGCPIPELSGNVHNTKCAHCFEKLDTGCTKRLGTDLPSRPETMVRLDK
ncbi:hypothetical protein SAMN05660479_01331 [Microbulbifer thermotolerans]|nr:hypothetical protein [Microbulbifer thermotolerans]SFC18803.1 hypothetical protein SAMN05660479_01331 [Microbulbifer thermotolerans]